MYRRAVVAGAFTVATAGCVDRLHDIAASTPRDLSVRSRYVPDDPLIADESIESRPSEMPTHVLSFRSEAAATAAMRSEATAARSFAESTRFLDDEGGAVLIGIQRLAPPGIDLRFGSASRIGDRSVRVGVDEVGHRPGDDDPTVHTLFVRLADDRGPPERVTVSIEDDRIGVTI